MSEFLLGFATAIVAGVVSLRVAYWWFVERDVWL
jgi:hypothetical protein